MKIYPCEHYVDIKEETAVNSLPLAVFSEAEENLSIVIDIAERFCKKSTETKVYPYQMTNDKNALLFDAKDNLIEDTSRYVKRIGKSNYYTYLNSVEFIPSEFHYSLCLKRNDSYKSSLDYKLRIGCCSLELAEMLIGLFNGESVLKPKNIIINNNELYAASMINQSAAGLDFLFARKSELTDEAIKGYLAEHINLWLFDDTDTGLFTRKREETSVKYNLIENGVFMNTESVAVSVDTYLVNHETAVNRYEADGYILIEAFKDNSPALMLHKPGEAFMVICHESMLDSLADDYKLIFEFMMSMYLNGYFQTRTRSQYITDNKLDYYIKPNRKFDAYHPRINKREIFYKDGFDDRIGYEVYDINIDRDDVVYLATDENSNMLFKKISKTDPEKEQNAVSIFTADNTVINYNPVDNVIKTIEDKLMITGSGNSNYITIEPFRSSSEHINHNFIQRLILESRNRYVVCYDTVLKEFKLIDELAYDKIRHGTAFATVQLQADMRLSCGDMRATGGGEIDASRNYEMIDTGYRYGRPYRIGSIMIIKLPTRFKPQETHLKTEIMKHVTSGDYPILVFTDEA